MSFLRLQILLSSGTLIKRASSAYVGHLHIAPQAIEASAVYLGQERQAIRQVPIFPDDLSKTDASMVPK
jgi:hypothetical protein